MSPGSGKQGRELSGMERRMYLPQWVQHEMFHNIFAHVCHKGDMEASDHIWFDRSMWPKDFEGLEEADYYHEAMFKRFVCEGNRALLFGNSGNTVYFLGAATLYQYTLATPYDTFSLSGSGTQVDLATTLSLDSNPYGFVLTSNGLVGLVLTTGASFDGDITQFTLGSAWDVSTVNASPKTVTRMSTVGGNIAELINGGLTISSATDKLFVSGVNSSYANQMYSYSIVPTP
jgi:hypothetical protein